MQRMLLVLVAVCSCSFANASVVRYSYQGQDLQTGGGSLGQPPLGPEGLTAISGYLEFGQALATGLSSVAVTGVLSYEFFDGVTVFDESNSFFHTIEVSTDSLGNLTAWLLTIPQSAPGAAVDSPEGMTISSSNSGSMSFPEYDSVQYAGGEACVGTECFPTSVIIRSTTVGQWSTAIVPVPAAIWLFGSSLFLLGWAKRQL